MKNLSLSLNISRSNKFKQLGFKKKLFSILAIVLVIPSLVTVFILNTRFANEQFCPVSFLCQTKASEAPASALINMLGLSIDPNNKTGSTGLPKIEELNELNVKWVRIELIENPVVNYKDLLTTLHQNNKKVILIVDYASIGSTPKPSSKSVPAGNVKWSTYRAKYIEKVRSVATEYKDLVDAWEIWNEPDLYVNESYDPYIPPIEYAKFLKEAASAIKASGANGKIIMGGLASGNVTYLRDTIFYYGNALLEYDGVGLHPYGQRPDNFNNSWGFGHIDNLLNSYYAMTSKPIWITEIGTEDTAVEAEYLSKFYDTIKRKHISRVPVVVWFCYSDSMVSPFGLIDSKGNKKAAYNAYKTILSSNSVLPAASIYDPPENATLADTKGKFKLTTLTSSPLKYKLTIKKANTNTVYFTKENASSVLTFDVAGLPNDGSELTSILDTIYTGATVSVNQKYIAVSATASGASTSTSEDVNWFAKIYENTTLSGQPTVLKEFPPASKEEPRAVGGLNIDWGWNISPDASKLPFKVNDYSIRFDRQKYFDEGLYRFKVVADEGAKVYLDNVMIIDVWDNKSLSSVYESPNVSISKGLHRVTVGYFEKSDTAKIKLWWEKVAYPTNVPTPAPTPVPTVVANKAGSISLPDPSIAKINASTTALTISWNSGNNVKTYDLKLATGTGAIVKEETGISNTVLTKTYQVNLAGTSQLNISLKTNYNDNKSESQNITYLIQNDFTSPPVDNSSSIVKINAYGIASMNVYPTVELYVSRSNVRSKIESKTITTAQDYIFKLPYKLHNTDKVYFRFCNDTSNFGSCTGLAGTANRDVVFNYAVIDDVTIKLKQNITYSSGKLGPIADIKYDRENREDSSLYDWGKIRDVTSTDGNFGTFYDSKAAFLGGERFSWGDIFNGFMPFNGAIVIGINWDQ